MKRSRIIQAILLLVVFIVAVALFNSGDAPTESTSEYVPPSP